MTLASRRAQYQCRVAHAYQRRSGRKRFGLTKTGTGLLTLKNIRSGGLTLTAGNVKLIADSGPGGVSIARALTINTNTKLDLSANKLITSNAVGTWNGSNYTGVAGLIALGKNGTASTWNGTTGIITSQSAAIGSNYTSLGVAAASDVRPATVSTTDTWAGQTISGSDTLVMYTYGGDATLDGKINIDDYTRIDNGIATNITGWSNGDFNYDGKVNIDDYNIIDQNLGTQGAQFFSAGSMSGGGPSIGGSAIGVNAVPDRALRPG